MTFRWRDYPTGAAFDEVLAPGARSRPVARQLARYVSRLSPEALERMTTAIKISLEDLGITFNVYNRQGGTIDRTWPLDLLPRVMAASEWREIEAGLIQRLIITRIPILIGEGIPLFGPLKQDVKLRHVKTKVFPNGLTQSEYEIAA